ncbi:MAG: hypothetical protein KTR31_07545 [Myxococcales bacterium]|nr:hypothetical protein [Myxococcales bacterium]
MRSCVWFGLLVTMSTACSPDYQIAGGAPPQGVENLPPPENPIQLDQILQVTIPVVDVLWIVDNSGSMADNQTELANNFPIFMTYFLGSGLDYHIGVVSTDVDNINHRGKLRESDGYRFITPKTKDPLTVFADMVQLGSTGSNTERGREAAYWALELEADGFNKGFLRNDEESGVHVIVISDEDDYSRQNVISKAEFIAYMNLLRARDPLVTFNSIVNPPGAGPLQDIDAGREYLALTDGIGGIKREIGNSSFTEFLQTLGLQAAGLKTEFHLSRLPVLETIDVWAVTEEGATIPFTPIEDYTYNARRNAIQFREFIPEPLTQINIEYTVLASLANPEPE